MLQFDDMGLDEYDVADERQHEIGFDRWEVNLDNMTYEELLQLQARIGYVNKGLNLDKIRSFPQMTKMELKHHLKQKKREAVGEEEFEESKLPSRHALVREQETPASRSIMKPQKKIQAELRAAQLRREFLQYESQKVRSMRGADEDIHDMRAAGMQLPMI